MVANTNQPIKICRKMMNKAMNDYRVTGKKDDASMYISRNYVDEYGT